MSLQINTKDLKARKNVEIDGHPYVVRRFGAGEQLTLNQLMRDASKIQDKLKDSESSSQEDEEKALDLFKQVIDIFAGIFDDGGDGNKSRELVSKLSQEELSELFNQIFPEAKDEATSES